MSGVELPVNYASLTAANRRLVRELYVQRQERMCYYCKSSLDELPPLSILGTKVNVRLFPIGFFKNKIHLHHSHETGLTLGAVHARCNAILWQYHDE